MTKKNYHPNDNLGRYFDEIRRFPMLSAEQEDTLARRWRDQRDPNALQQLIGSHLRLAVKIARAHSGYGLPLGDLISQGHLGLMLAADKFDPDRGARFATYATWWVRASIREHVLYSWSLVKMGTTASQKKLFFNLRRLKSRLRQFEPTDLSEESIESIASELGVPALEVLEMDRRLSVRDQSLNVGVNIESDDEWQDFLPEEAADQETRLIAQDELAWRRGLLEQGLVKLTERERHILNERRLSENPRTLDSLSREYGISRERVRQIENRAFEKLRKTMLRTARYPEPNGESCSAN